MPLVYLRIFLVEGIGEGVGESVSAVEKDSVKRQYERPIMKLKILYLVFLTYTCAIIHHARCYHSVTKMITTSSPMIGKFFNNAIVASTDKE